MKIRVIYILREECLGDKNLKKLVTFLTHIITFLAICVNKSV